MGNFDSLLDLEDLSELDDFYIDDFSTLRPENRPLEEDSDLSMWNDIFFVDPSGGGY